jgi:D-serine deaminase-like pyridoxal phosphate-dependent protein
MDPIQKLINDWHAKEKAAEAARQAQLRLEAKQAADAAEAAREAALRRHDAIGIAEAAEQASAASDALRAAEAPIRVQIKSASGGGRTMAPRVHKRVKINNLRLAFMETMEDAGVIEAIEKALNARIRSKDWDGEVPSGCTIIEEETVV